MRTLHRLFVFPLGFFLFGFFLFGFFLLGLYLREGAPVFATSSHKIKDDAPVFLWANELIYERDLGIFIASGEVVAQQEGRILKADKVIYNERTNLVTASGHVSLRDPTGDVIFVEYIVLTGDLKEGVAREVRLLMADRARLAAAQSRRLRNGQRIEFDQVSYTPCNRCQDNPNAPPLWQVNARQVTRDTQAGEMTYVDGHLSFLDVPVFYFPYLSVPLKRRSGFLAPIAGSSTELGAFVGVPYYFDLDPEAGDEDLTFMPRLTAKQGVIWGTEYRRRFLKGQLKLEGSLNTTRPREVKASSSPVKERLPGARGHLFATGRLDLNENWRFGFNEQQVTDKSYLRTRPFFNSPSQALYTSDPVLESRYFAERFTAKDYLSLQGFHYIGLKDQDRFREAPLILPVLDYHHVSRPGLGNSFFTTDVNLLSLHRRKGNNSQRIVLDGRWSLPETNSLGQTYTFFTQLRGDLYNTEVFKDGKKIFKGTTGRFFPQVGAEWRWPFIHPSSGVIVEPIVQVIGAPQGRASFKIPNEDSRGFELNEENLLIPSRFPGLDLLDYGSRTNYGIQVLSRENRLGTVLFFLGQSYSFANTSNDLKGSGIGNRLSDIVGRLSMIPSLKWFSLNYRFRLDHRLLKSRYNETEVVIGPEALNICANYIFTSPEAMTPTLGKFEQIGISLNTKQGPFWSAQISTTRNLKNDATRFETLSQGAALSYQDECFTTSLRFYRTYYQSQGVKPGNTILISVVFKNLGSISYQKQDRSPQPYHDGMTNPFATYE